MKSTDIFDGALTLAAAALTFALGCPPPAPVVFVDDDSTCVADCGSFENPWPTISQGVDAAEPGWIVHINEGSYPAPVDTIDKDGLIIEGDGAGLTLIDASPLAFFILNADGVIVRGIGFTNPSAGATATGVVIGNFAGQDTTNITITTLRAGNAGCLPLTIKILERFICYLPCLCFLSVEAWQ